MEENNPTEKPKGNKNMVLGGIVVLIVLIGGAMLLSSNDSSTSSPSPTATIEATSLTADEAEIQGESNNNEDALAEESLEIEVEGGSFYYEPNEIRVGTGQAVTITLNSVDMMHDFVIDELNVATEVIPGGESTSVTFTAPDTPGEYEFYCSVGNHKAQGMVGTLIVE